MSTVSITLGEQPRVCAITDCLNVTYINAAWEKVDRLCNAVLIRTEVFRKYPKQISPFTSHKCPVV